METTAIVAAETGNRRSFGRRAFFGEGTTRCMAAHASVARAVLPHAAPDAAGAVGAMHHDTSLDAPATSWTKLLFFCGAQGSSPEKDVPAPAVVEPVRPRMNWWTGAPAVARMADTQAVRVP